MTITNLRPTIFPSEGKTKGKQKDKQRENKGKTSKTPKPIVIQIVTLGQKTKRANKGQTKGKQMGKRYIYITKKQVIIHTLYTRVKRNFLLRHGKMKHGKRQSV